MPTPLAGYTPYKNLPPLAGLCTVEEAAKPGLSVEECVRRLKRFHYCFKRLHQILTARITAEPIYELKTGFAHHAYLCAEHVTALRTRIGEMREPPLGLEDVPHPALEVFFDEILCAPTTEELVSGHGAAVYALWNAIAQYEADTNPLTDAPSRRLLRFARIEVDDMMNWGSLALNGIADPENEAQRLEWCRYLGRLLEAAGGLDGSQEPTPQPPPRREGEQEGAPTYSPSLRGGGWGAGPPRRYSATPYQYDPVPKRDERFTDPWNQGVNAEAFLYNEAYPARAKALMMLYKRLREIDVPEMMASIIAQTPGKPWGYYRDMSRQLWDEARHAMMGEVGFVALGVDWTKAKITFNWSHRLNTECTPMERHGVLYFIEQGLMPRTGKRYEFEVGQASGLPLIATIQDFDWADEVLHSQIGRSWYVPQFGSLREALDYGDAAWSKVLSNWATVKEQGLTQHENWWPAVYRMACAADGTEPDPQALAFAETYEAKRADLQRIAAE
ncbi:hypothetical protein GobsT_68080 [Gemmata obscuriglobus]|uniref:Uncharacterized protein n=1 Tax=Gemmata obscuriglobus TaxID=114 RepID=A0A2Z3HEV1_9BACT|nr:hypothetical protein [Gemmata obscuriglobus]AWM42047.1 hypothetical protein C1280_37025 [Gemmata obscuriglobus]QEG31960.1 hypothetical protein GobsT_68080 [Gemmata obscuriglobus]VTS11310.1 Uncharacterized protein OS=Singulisphaera acidiphila (strain ATCC BAA-1392 / DSM 18658 / VKM B-2454 / MOB10) GN=Sinac_7023 PE=4 SV=1 [Gemmata obscuriglobus UQM 2246]